MPICSRVAETTSFSRHRFPNHLRLYLYAHVDKPHNGDYNVSSQSKLFIPELKRFPVKACYVDPVLAYTLPCAGTETSRLYFHTYSTLDVRVYIVVHLESEASVRVLLLHSFATL